MPTNLWKDLAAETNKSVITDHVAKDNNVTDWSNATILDIESQQRKRQLKESIRIHMEANCMKGDGGAKNLSTTYHHILVTRSSSTSRDHMPDEVSPLANETSQLGRILAYGCVI